MSFENEIKDFTESIWKNTLDLEVSPSDIPFKPNGKENTLAGCVHITGEWQGTIAVTCPMGLAKKAAGIMFSQAEDESTTDDIRDALGELANMTGGNIKSLLPEPCYLSLPTVAVTDFELRIPGSELIAMLTFKCEEVPFVVTMVKKAENGTGK